MKMKIIKKLFLGVFICFIICSFSFSKDFDGVFGMYRLELHENAGTFTLSMLDSDSEKFVPVFNPLDNSSGTLLYLKSGSKVYPLSKLGGVPIIHNMTENSATITYNIKGVAEVNFIFSFVYSATGFFTENSDLVIIDVLVKNLSKTVEGVKVLDKDGKEVKFLILAIITCLLTTVFAAFTMVAVYGII